MALAPAATPTSVAVAAYKLAILAVICTNNQKKMVMAAVMEPPAVQKGHIATIIDITVK